jgi:hypothetical protein
MFNGRRQPSRGGTSRMTRECHVRFCERLGPTRLVSRVTPVHTAMRNRTKDEGRSFEVGNQVLISAALHKRSAISLTTASCAAWSSAVGSFTKPRDPRAVMARIITSLRHLAIIATIDHLGGTRMKTRAALTARCGETARRSFKLCCRASARCHRCAARCRAALMRLIKTSHGSVTRICCGRRSCARWLAGLRSCA